MEAEAELRKLTIEETTGARAAKTQAAEVAKAREEAALAAGTIDAEVSDFDEVLIKWGFVSNCVEIKFQAPHAIDATAFP